MRELDDMIKATLVVFALLALPGWAFLGVSKIWRFYSPFQRWMLAFGLGLAGFPILFYMARLLPGFRIGNHKLVIILVLALLLISLSFRRTWKEQVQFDTSELVALTLFVIILFTRLWVIRLYPYPAWSDSLHHVLLTQLTAQNGRLPYTLEPFEPVNLSMYHLGLYAFTAAIMILAKVPATTALLVGAQILNALNVSGIYLVLDRFVNRWAAIFGMLFVGLLSFQPAWYFNWGRFTQVSSQMLLPIAWLLTIETLRGLRSASFPLFWGVIFSSITTASLFLLHFRVAGLYLPLLFVSVATEFVISIIRSGYFWKATRVLIAIGFFSLFLIFPVLLDALNVYINQSSSGGKSSEANAITYYTYYPNTIYSIGLRRWVVYLLVAASLVGALWRDRLVIEQGIWMVCLWIIGHFYLLPIRGLAFINYTGIMIMFYIPAAIIFGAVISKLYEKVIRTELIARHQNAVKGWFFAVFLAVVSISAQVRVTAIESFRFFMTPQDEEAMLWIKDHTPEDAIFAVDTYLWLGYSPHGVDAGYWIPYYTGRKTTTGTMMYAQGNKDYVSKVINFGVLVSKIQNDESVVKELCKQGVKYLYIGAKRDRLFGSFDPGRMVLKYNKYIIYSKNGTTIFKLCP